MCVCICVRVRVCMCAGVGVLCKKAILIIKFDLYVTLLTSY